MKLYLYSVKTDFFLIKKLKQHIFGNYYLRFLTTFIPSKLITKDEI